jgi:tRNA pseudouridine55 synthase
VNTNDGLLLIDKPQGMTSHDVVARVRRIIGIRAIGHAGTLDPFATGLLILCVGNATRLSEYLLGEIKSYSGRMKLGERTNTDDLDGEVIERREVHATPEDIERARAAFTGDISQVPPQYSAIQIGGKRAYKLARSGETVELQARPVQILELTLAFAGESTVDLRMKCTAGTYVRALARDVGEMLGCGAHLVSLRREQSGPFRLASAITLETLQQAAASGDWTAHLLPKDRAVDHFPAHHLSPMASGRLLLGQTVQTVRGSAGIPAGKDAGAPADKSMLCRVYDASGAFIAIGEFDSANGAIKPVKVFHINDTPGRVTSSAQRVQGT